VTADVPALEATGLHRSYREGPVLVHAVRGVDLTVHSGRLVLLMGPSGSGKSSLLSMLGCILRPTRGDLRIMGRRVVWDERLLPAIRKTQLGFVFQSFNLLSSLTAAENVAMTLTLRGDTRHGIARARRMLEGVGLGHRWNFMPRDLSGGEKQRVAVARALIGDPPILLADEPTGNLDSTSGRMVTEMLRRSATEQGRAVVVVSHDARIADYADEVCVLEDGRIVSRQVRAPLYSAAAAGAFAAAHVSARPMDAPYRRRHEQD
jgi:putative ABC transport system ATP-binding protein